MKEFLIKPQSYILYNLKLYYFVGLVETSNEWNVDIDIQPHSCQHFCHLLSVPAISIAFNCPSWLEQEQAHNELTYWHETKQQPETIEFHNGKNRYNNNFAHWDVSFLIRIIDQS